ncbi:MAG: murein biosynthesis integral membrane protein MurJ [Planctomycetota bacterium]|nr:MAG: murein biosynthesis integral membrane protein MurJ [Planctomycetota bacterium]
MAQDARYLGSARIIAICTLCSRVTGLARDILLNHVYGQKWVQDAFNYGFLIPNLFRRLFGEGALSAIFIPIFTETLDQRGRDAAWTLLGRVAGLMVLLLTLITLVLEAIVLGLWWFETTSAMHALQLALTAVMMPFMIGICVLALFSSILNCLNHFTVPALLPIVLNVLNMIGVLYVGPMIGEALDRQIYGVALSVLAASLLQIAIIVPVMKRHGVAFRFSVRWNDPDVRRIGRMFLPVVLGQGVLLFSVFFDAQLCTFLTRGPGSPDSFVLFGRDIKYPLVEGALSAVNNAQRLYQFPLGVLAISLATAVFPLFSLYASRRDLAGLRSTLGQSVRVALFEGLPCALVLIVLAEPIVALLFEHGRFGPDATARAAWVLTCYAIGVPAFCCQHILLRGFYSLKDTLTPMWISAALVALNIAISLTLVWRPAIREAAFGISTAVTAYLHCGVSLWLLRRRMQGRIGARLIAKSAAKTVAASALVLLVLVVVYQWTGKLPLAGLGRTGVLAVRVFLPILAAVGAYFGAAAALRCEEVRWLAGGRTAAAADACGLK